MDEQGRIGEGQGKKHRGRVLTPLARRVGGGVALLGFVLFSILSVVAHAKASPVVTFAGLHVEPGGSAALTVELTEPAEVVSLEEGRQVRLLLRGAKIRFRNNENPLLAQHFCSSVLRAKLDRGKEGVTVTIELRQAVTVKHQMKTAESGSTLVVDIDKPKELPPHCQGR